MRSIDFPALGGLNSGGAVFFKKSTQSSFALQSPIRFDSQELS